MPDRIDDDQFDRLIAALDRIALAIATSGSARGPGKSTPSPLRRPRQKRIAYDVLWWLEGQGATDDDSGVAIGGSGFGPDSRVIANLRRAGLIVKAGRGGTKLTAKGRRLARFSRRDHQVDR